MRAYGESGQYTDVFLDPLVTDAVCASPAPVLIVADALTGTGSLTVNLSATFAGADASPVFRWDFGDGATDIGRAVAHTFLPGRYRIRLEAVSSDGCVSTSWDEVEVGAPANQPPRCEVFATPALGAAPLVATFTGRFGDADGTIVRATWTFSDGVIADALLYNAVASRTLERAGAFTATLDVEDDQGLTCRASMTVDATGANGLMPPEIVSRPTLQAVCGQPYVYGDDGIVRVTGSRPITFSLGKGTGIDGQPVGQPEGMTIDATGAVVWTPPVEKTHAERVTLVAENGAGAVDQDFMVQVDCPQAPGGCGGCQSSEGGLVGILLFLGPLLVRRRGRGKMGAQKASSEDEQRA
jgi:PKD repeat protein